MMSSPKVNYQTELLMNSPRNVIDISLFELDEDKLRQNLDLLRTPLSPLRAEDTDSSLPPLNTLSVCSSSVNGNDDSSSVSSVSLDEDSWPSTEKRCIFASYWEKKGGRPQQPLAAPTTRAASPSDTSSTSSSANGGGSYEQLLEKNEAPATRRASYDHPSNASRRRLWDNHYVSQSQPSLSNYCRMEAPIRKTQSAPVVGPRASILRRGRYSVSSVPHTISRRSSSGEATASVSFSDEVQVQYLRTVTENWASRGWSKQFM